MSSGVSRERFVRLGIYDVWGNEEEHVTSFCARLWVALGWSVRCFGERAVILRHLVDRANVRDLCRVHHPAEAGW